AAFLTEIALSGLGKPRRHIPALCYVRHLGGVAFGVIKAEQRKRSRFAGPVTWSAIPIDDGRDVTVKGDVFGRFRRVSGACGECDNQQCRHAQRAFGLHKSCLEDNILAQLVSLQRGAVEKPGARRRFFSTRTEPRRVLPCSREWAGNSDRRQCRTSGPPPLVYFQSR